jgi:anti-sigma regulatory factor (Ser/Thr protein kinase)
MEAHCMNGAEQLTLRSQLTELSRVPQWLEQLASVHGIPSETQFSIDLCLEEILTNIILHGYAGSPDHTIVVRYKADPKSFLFVVDDEAPHFNPLEQSDPSATTSDEIQVGGQGIHLVRQFAQSLEYEPTPTGNRLRLGFASAA